MAALTAPGPTLRSLRLTLVALGLALLAFALVELVLFAEGDIAPLWVLSLLVAEGLLWGGTGLLAWSRRPSNRTGPLLVAGGAAFLLSGLGNTTPRPLAALGALLGAAPLGVSVHLLMAFPSGRVRGRAARLAVLSAYTAALVTPLPAALLTPGSPVAVGDVPGLVRLSQVSTTVLGGVTSVVVAVLLVLRLRSTAPGDRRALAPLFAYGAGATVAITFAAQLQNLTGLSDLVRFVLQLAALAVVPVAFTAVLLRGGFARTGAVEELGSRLVQDQAPTRDVLADVLGDPSLELLHWLPSEGTWADGAGRPVPLAPEPGRGLVEVAVGGRRTGALTYDTGLLSDPGLVTAAARPAGLALEAQRLSVELRRSRARLLAAADAERRRLARDLHDGLQVRLVLLGLESGRLATRAGDPEVVEGLRRLREATDEAAAELRRTVAALLPAGLVERGLGAAVADLVDRLPLPTRLELVDLPPDLPDDVATTAWYVVTEGVTNALKHAGASALQVRVGGHDDGVVVEVEDDGRGGASLERGAGLRGLVDRLDVLAGRLSVDDVPGGGTRLRAVVPVAG